MGIKKGPPIIPEVLLCFAISQTVRITLIQLGDHEFELVKYLFHFALTKSRQIHMIATYLIDQGGNDMGEVGGFGGLGTSVAAILVLFILLVIITKSFF